MNAQQYEKLTANIRKSPNAIRAITYIDKAITWLITLSYPVFLIAIYFLNKDLLFHSILIPGVSFVVVSIYRHFNHSKRPYEALDIDPLIKKDKKEHSFPSRHVFSAFILAMTYMQFSIPLGIITLVLGATLAYIRVLGGVHFPADVIAGAIIGIAAGCMFFIL